MITTLSAWVLAASASLVPGRSHATLAEAIVRRTSAEAPLFADDESRQKTAALLVAIAFRESSLRIDAKGDKVRGKPTSFCAFQINLPYGAKTAEGWTGEELTQDADKCVTTALRILRASMKACPAHPLALYAAGPGGCTMPKAQRISRDRVAIARDLVKKVPFDRDAREASAVPLEPAQSATR